MALNKTIETLQGIEVVDAYHRVENVSLRGKNQMVFVVRSYANVTKPNFQEVNFIANYNLESSNPIRQAYEYLKTLPEFAGATDC